MAAKTKKRRHGRGGIKIPLAVVFGFAPLVKNIYDVSGGGFSRMAWMATQAMTGYDTDTQKWWLPNLQKGLLPIIGGFLVHYIVGQKLGLNRALGRAGIPLIRI